MSVFGDSLPEANLVPRFAPQTAGQERQQQQTACDQGGWFRHRRNWSNQVLTATGSAICIDRVPKSGFQIVILNIPCAAQHGVGEYRTPALTLLT